MWAESIMFLNLIVTQVALEMHKDLIEIQSLYLDRSWTSRK